MLPSLQHNTNIHAPGGIRTHDPSKRAVEDPRLRPHGHWDRLFEPAISATKRSQTYALDRTATGIHRDNIHSKAMYSSTTKETLL